jgi:hypothetical protein
MTLILAWIVFPLVLTALCLGCGLFVEWVAGIRLDPVLILPVGLSALIVVAQLATMTSATAPLATPAVVVVAVAGIGLSPPLRRRVARFALAAATGAFAVFAAPVVLTGNATIPGWIKLDDTTTWLALTDRAMEHGRSVAGLPVSSYELTLSVNFAAGYPLGAFMPLGVGGQLVRQDLAWLFQPYQAFLAAALALALYSLVSRAVANRILCGVIAFFAAQAGLYYGYALWGGLKEVAAAPLIAVVAAVVPTVLDRNTSAWAVIPLAVGSAAALGTLTAGGAIWLAPILLGAGWLAWRAKGAVFTLVATGAFAVITLALSVPTLAITGAFSNSAGVVTKNTELGNLIRPLKFVQIFGIWPVGDFRGDPGHLPQTYVLIGIAALATAFGVWQAVRRDAPEVALFVASALFGAVILTQVASPWIGAKGLASAAPALVAAALVGGSALFESGRRVEGLVALLAVAGGVAWTNVLQYHDVSLAPRAQLSELSTIGNRFAGDGPALMMEYSPYGVRHFLRKIDPESAGEFRWRQIPLRNGTEVGQGGYADIDEVQLEAVLVYRTLVLNRSPVASRPPSFYRLVWQGRFYDVWQRPAAPGTRILEHLSLGGGDQATGVPKCSDVLRIASEANQAGGSLVAVVRPPAVVFPLSQAAHPTSWATYSGSPAVIYPSRSGTLEAKVSVPTAGRYGVWLGGSFRRHLEVRVDGRLVGQGRHELNHPGVYTPMGEVDFTAGSHDVELRYSPANLSPGSGGAIPPYAALGPLVLGRYASELPTTTIKPANARSLCGKSLDWVEAVARS